jgi:hypothetical protein
MTHSPQIQPLNVVRDEGGYWTHPALPDFDEGASAYEHWCKDQGLQIYSIDMVDDLPEGENHPYFEFSSNHCLGWEPQPPTGDGWFCLAISDTEDGPAAFWARRVTDEQREVA